MEARGASSKVDIVESRARSRCVCAADTAGCRVRGVHDAAVGTGHAVSSSSASHPTQLIARWCERWRPAWTERAIWALVYAASEAVDHGTLAAHQALDTVVRTIEHGITR